MHAVKFVRTNGNVQFFCAVKCAEYKALALIFKLQAGEIMHKQGLVRPRTFVIARHYALSLLYSPIKIIAIV